MMWWWGGPFPVWGVVLGWLWMVLFWGALIALVVLAVRQFTAPHREGGGGHSPLDILKERYAKGEITREQYEQMKKDIGG